MDEIIRRTKNKTTKPDKKHRMVNSLVDEFGIDPLEAMFRIAMHDETDSKLKADMWKELAKYYQPQLKSVDVTTHGQQEININIMRFSDQKEE